MQKSLLLTLFPLVLFLGCTQQRTSAYTPQQIDSLKTVFQEHIQEIVHEFKTAQWSPIPQEDRAGLTTLRYYPYDITWRYSVPLHRYAKQDSIVIKGSKQGDIRPALRYGYFEFNRNGKIHRLQIIKILPTRAEQQAHLFLGFWDATSGEATYGGGRYIDIEEQAGDQYIIDFNYAYNPYCAYSHRYSCAVPPFENRLAVPVTAGEKKYKDIH